MQQFFIHFALLSLMELENGSLWLRAFIYLGLADSFNQIMDECFLKILTLELLKILYYGEKYFEFIFRLIIG